MTSEVICALIAAVATVVAALAEHRSRQVRILRAGEQSPPSRAAKGK